MKLPTFHDPNFCPAVFRRNVADFLLSAIEFYGDVLMRRNVWRLLGGCETDASFYSAMDRLRRAGLIVYPGRGVHRAQIELTEAARARRPPELHPHTYWERPWHGYWHLLSYDVPEAQREFRDALRGFFRRLRMGQLHQSAWISCRDVRPEYEDLRKTARVEEYAWLFEARTVLDMDPLALVRRAWDFDALEERHGWYLETANETLVVLQSEDPAPETLAALGRDAMGAYLAVMADDPLLPRELWPQGYRGHRVYEAHRQLAATIAGRLRKAKLKRTLKRLLGAVPGTDADVAAQSRPSGI